MDLERKFDERDFESMMFPIFHIPETTNLLSKFPQLKNIDGFQKFKHDFLQRDKVIRYVMYCYDRESPIFKKFITDDIKRKTTAAHYAGFFSDDNGIFDEPVEKMMKCMFEEVNNMIIDFIKLYNDPEMALLAVGYESLFEKLQVIIQRPEDDTEALEDSKIKGELFKQAKAITNDLNEMSTKILTDENRYLKRGLYNMIDQHKRKRLGISPEERAKRTS